MATMKNLQDVLEQRSEFTEELNEKIHMLFGVCIETLDSLERQLKDFLQKSHTINGMSFPVSGSESPYRQYRFILPTTEIYLMPHIQYCVEGILNESTDKSVRYDTALTINKALEQLLAIEQGHEQYVQGYVVATEGVMNLIRVDYIVWCRRNSPGILEKEVKYAIGAVAVKSNIDVSKISFSDFCAVYQSILLDGLPKDLSVAEKAKLISEAIETARNIFIAMGGKMENVKTKDISISKENLVKFSEVISIKD